MAGDDLLIKNIKRGELSFEWNDAPLLWQHVGPDQGQIGATPGARSVPEADSVAVWVTKRETKKPNKTKQQKYT